MTSGPIVTAFLHERLSRWSRRRFTYRFVVAPETIGSIAYLSRYGQELNERLRGGFVLTCLGGEEPLSCKLSRRETSDLDLLVKHLFEKRIPGHIRPFTPIYGSDERQYCSPGYNLPVVQMSRRLHKPFREYHSSLDTKESMTIEALQRSVDELELVLKAFELDGYYVNTNPYGEVKLDRHGLYPDMNSHRSWKRSNNDIEDSRVQLNRILLMLNYSDGRHALREIARKAGCTVLEMERIVAMLKERGLLAGPFPEERGLFE